MILDDVAENFAQKKVIRSAEFFDPHAQDAPTFVLELHFGKPKGCLGSYIRSVDKAVVITKFKFKLYDGAKFLRDGCDLIFGDGPYLLEGDELCGLPEMFKRRESSSAGRWRLWCKFSYETFFEPESAPKSNLPIQSDFLKLFKKSSNADVTFKVKEEKFPAHKIILSARSKYFANMFKSEMTESVTNEVEVTDIEPRVFKGMLEFLYSGKLPKDSLDISLELLVAADKYGLKELERTCEEVLCDNLNRNNVVDTLVVAHRVKSYKLLTHAKLAFRGWSECMTSNTRGMNSLLACPDLVVELLKNYSSNSDLRLDLL